MAVVPGESRESDVEEAKPLKGGAMRLLEERQPPRHILGLPISVFAGAAYCTASMSMVRRRPPPPPSALLLHSFCFRSCLPCPASPSPALKRSKSGP